MRRCGQSEDDEVEDDAKSDGRDDAWWWVEVNEKRSCS